MYNIHSSLFCDKKQNKIKNSDLNLQILITTTTYQYLPVVFIVRSSACQPFQKSVGAKRKFKVMDFQHQFHLRKPKQMQLDKVESQSEIDMIYEV